MLACNKIYQSQSDGTRDVYSAAAMYSAEIQMDETSAEIHDG